MLAISPTCARACTRKLRQLLRLETEHILKRCRPGSAGGNEAESWREVAHFTALADTALETESHCAHHTLTMETVTADKGYHAVDQMQALQHEEIKAVIADPVSNRRLDKLQAKQRQAGIAIRIL